MADSVTQSGNPRRRDIPSQVTDRIIRYDTGFTSSEDEYQHNTKPQYIVENTDDVYRGFDELTPNSRGIFRRSLQNNAEHGISTNNEPMETDTDNNKFVTPKKTTKIRHLIHRRRSQQ